MIIQCERCEALTDHRELATYDSYDEDGLLVRYAFLSCPACGSAALAGREEYAEDVWSDPFRLYPPRVKPISSAIPSALRDAYAEAITCHRAKAFTASAIMCRKSLEGLSDSHGVASTNLASGLRQLSTHYSFKEIAERLHVSPHTVKSQAMSVYRKFGVSSRSQAIHRAHTLGLLTA